MELSAWIMEAFCQADHMFCIVILHDLDFLSLIALCAFVGRIGVVVNKNGVSRYSCGNICNR